MDKRRKFHPRREGPVHEASAEPSSPLASWDVRLVAADIADALAGQPLDGPNWRTTWLRVHAEAEGRVSFDGRRLPTPADQEARRELLGADAVDQVIGWVNVEGAFVPGLAGLTAQERDAVDLWLSPNEEGGQRDAAEVRNLMDRRRGRHGVPLAIETVEGHLSRARAKLSRLARL